MGHLLSKNGYRLKKRTRKLQSTGRRRRGNCFLQLPCMPASSSTATAAGLDDEGDHLEAGINGSACRHSITGISVPGVGGSWQRSSSCLEARRAIRNTHNLLKTAPSSCFLRGSWLSGRAKEGASYQLFLPKLVPLPALFRSAGVSVNVPLPVPGSTSDHTEMVCKRKCSEVQRREGLTPLITQVSTHLPSSILLKVLSHLTVKGALSYWRDLCLDFQFWKQIDLSGLQQVTDDLLVKIASRRQNVTEINISDCRGCP
ncbi:hypothetical protein KUCAC02_028110 [Chaenocephalus aceratus]|uniref:Uncharacterized protein n=1 Tax=Chaenocephalus aceratus TaxID=36190 RepID=A0ACB9X1Q6_CHAAC|nr:hypothetical protein KUCAC02_028110 [Chaenocephalus aceratus]